MAGLSFLTSPKYFLTSESVTEGHPDKLCDQVSDGVLDAVLRDDPMGRVACETATTNGLVLVMGEITTKTYVDIPRIARDTIRKIGYTDVKYGLDYRSCGVMVAVQEQSPDIAAGVGNALEARGHAADLDAQFDKIGAGDQGMMIGFACTETPELMPLPISLAHQLTKRLAEVRKEGELPWLGPDGKSQVTIEYSMGRPVRADTVVISTQHLDSVDNPTITREVMRHVIEHVVPAKLLQRTRVLVNPSGRFVLGGPMADTGLTGRKILVDSYGGLARHGGGAFSGKDPTKVDRSGAYAARYVAKNIVAAGLAARCEIYISYAIGVARPTSIAIETFGTAAVDDQLIEHLVRKHFDLRPAGIIHTLDLRRPIYQQTAAYGHFGRLDLDLPWERTDKVKALRVDAGLE